MITPEPVGVGGCEQYRYLVEQYDWDVEIMMAIMPLESTYKGVQCNRYASNWVDSHATCNGSHGLLQVGCIHGFTVEQLHDPAFNIEAAYGIWKKQGYNAWYNSYNKYLASK